MSEATNAVTLPARTGGTSKWHLSYLLFIAGMGGLLCGIDIGIISAALLYLDKTISLSEREVSFIVAAVLGGSMLASLVTGFLADWIGRKWMMIISGLIFVVSIVLIYTSQGFVPLLLGRLLMGVSAGVIGIVIPLYLAECLTAATRGRGTALFQFTLTFGIVVAALVGVYFTNLHDNEVRAAAGNAAQILAADNAAWRHMFLVAIIPGLIYTAGTLLLAESPRWLFRRGRQTEAANVLSLTRSTAEAAREMDEMRQHATAHGPTGHVRESLLKRKYVIPFLLACVILTCNQTTGITSILQYLTVILKQAGMSDVRAAQGDLIVKILNCVMTFVGVALVDRRGRKFLLKMGTTGIIIAFVFAGVVYRQFEAERVDVSTQIAQRVHDRELALPLHEALFAQADETRAMQLSVLYHYDNRQGVATAFSNDQDPVLTIQPQKDDKGALVIERAKYGPIPSALTGWLVAGALCLFIASFSAGPGVCVWLALSELMPTRIRSQGMGIAMLLNSIASTSIAAVFLPVVGNYGYATMFFFWAGCTVIYFITAAFFLPETKGKTLEEIEDYFDRKKPQPTPA